MTRSNTYNGWRNVETWRVQLHLANDEGEASHMLNHARWQIGSGYLDNSTGEPVPEPTPDDNMAEYVREYVTRQTLPRSDPAHDTWATLKADTVAAALERVDWESIANHWLGAARDEMTTHGVQP
jgi:hypothetical protein